MAGHQSRSSSIMSMRSQRSTDTSQHKKAAMKSTSSLQPLKFYWNRPLGASTGTFRLTVCLASSNSRQQKEAPLSWSLAYTSVDELCTAILDSPMVVAVELVGSAEAYEALGVPSTRESSWNKIRDALVAVLHRCRDDNSSSSSSSTASLIQSLQFASGVMDQQTASLLASTLKKKGPSKYIRREVEPPKYSVRIHYDTDVDTDTTQQLSSSSSSSSSTTDTLQQLWVGRDQLHELHLNFQGDGGGCGAYPYAITVQDATLLAEILPHLHIVSFHRVVFACPAAWKLVFASLEESSFLEHLHLDVSVLNHNQNKKKNRCKSKWKGRNDSSGATTAVTTTTTAPGQMATVQAYLDWHVRLNTVRRCLVERDCEVQSVQSKSTRSRRFLAYQQRRQQQVSDDGIPHATMTVEAQATETATVMDAAVVVLKDWWRATHRPDLLQYQYHIPETESNGVYPPTATGIDKNSAAEIQRSEGLGPAPLEQRAALDVAN